MLFPASKVEPGRGFRKKNGQVVYLRLSPGSVKSLGLDPKRVYGVAENGNVTWVNEDTEVHIHWVSMDVQDSVASPELMRQRLVKAVAAAEDMHSSADLLRMRAEEDLILSIAGKIGLNSRDRVLPSTRDCVESPAGVCIYPRHQAHPSCLFCLRPEDDK